MNMYYEYSYIHLIYIYLYIDSVGILLNTFYYCRIRTTMTSIWHTTYSLQTSTMSAAKSSSNTSRTCSA